MKILYKIKYSDYLQLHARFCSLFLHNFKSRTAPADSEFMWRNQHMPRCLEMLLRILCLKPLASLNLCKINKDIFRLRNDKFENLLPGSPKIVNEIGLLEPIESFDKHTL